MGERSDEFLGIFTDIEKCIKEALERPRGARFMDVARDYVHAYNLPLSYLSSLQTFATLRNAIDHNSYRGVYPIAEPIPEIVAEIRQIRDRIRTPPEAISVLPQMDVCLAQWDEPISSALEHVRQFDFSQIPVYESDRYAGILTTNTIARWLAQQIADGTLHWDASIREVMEFRERSDLALLVDRSLTAADAIYQLAQGSPEGGPVNALIVTENKLPTDKPVRIIVMYDVPMLSAALKFD
jgi:predicted transcriptional regulator